MQDKNSRECSIIAYFFSKFDEKGLVFLGYPNYSAAFNDLGTLFDKKPSYIKLKRDEFDAIVSSVRQGFHKRPPAKDVWELHSELKALSYEELAKMVRGIICRQKDISNNPIKENESNHPVATNKGNIGVTNEKKKRNSVSDSISYVNEYYKTAVSRVKGSIYKANNRFLSITISKPYVRKSGTEYWYSIYPPQRAALSDHDDAQVVFTFSDMADTLIVVDYKKMSDFFSELEKTEKEGGYIHYHIRFFHTNEKWLFLTTKGKYDILTLNGFVLSKQNREESKESENNASGHTRLKITSTNFHEISVKKKKR